MVEDLDLDAVLRQLVGFYLLERLFRHPHEDTRVAAGTQMPPFHDQFEVGDRALRAHHPDRLARAA